MTDSISLDQLAKNSSVLTQTVSIIICLQCFSKSMGSFHSWLSFILESTLSIKCLRGQYCERRLVDRQRSTLSGRDES